MIQFDTRPHAITQNETKRRPRRRRLRYHPLWYVGYAILILWAIVTIGPFVEMGLLSFKSNFGIYADPFGLTGFNPGNYPIAWNGPLGQVGFVTYFVNTIEVAVLAVLLGVGFGTLAGYSLARKGGQVGTIVFRVFSLGWGVPVIVTVFAYYYLLSNGVMLHTP